jgi:hypothetical protein
MKYFHPNNQLMLITVTIVVQVRKKRKMENLMRKVQLHSVHLALKKAHLHL